MINVKSAAEIAKMARAAEIVVRAMAAGRRLITAGRTTAAIDEEVHGAILKAGGRPAFLGYMGFPAATCISLNAEVVHGIPSAERVVVEGDLVSVDVGVESEGYYADAAFTVAVGDAGETAAKLLEAGRRCLARAAAACEVGKRLGDVAHAIESAAAEAGFDVIREYVGHGIGTRVHEEPQVPNFGPAGRGPRLTAGMTLALEPMLVAGDWRTQVARDGWTVSTRDGGLAVHFEHTVAITDDGPAVLTRGWEEFV
jgi:methionyl aminopeptidase